MVMERRKGMRKIKMQALRLNKREQREIHAKWLELNRDLVLNNGVPMTEAEFVHAVLRISIGKSRINKYNQVTLDECDCKSIQTDDK